MPATDCSAARTLSWFAFKTIMVATLPKIAPGQTQVVNSALFAGPEEEKKLEAIAPGLDLVKDYGIFAIISKPLYWLLNQLHGILGNWGWSIVALVVLLKAAFYWLNAKAYASMAGQCAKADYKAHAQCEAVRRQQQIDEEKRNPTMLN